MRGSIPVPGERWLLQSWWGLAAPRRDPAEAARVRPEGEQRPLGLVVWRPVTRGQAGAVFG